MKNKTHFINNQWFEGKGNDFPSFNPATGEKIWEGRAASNEQVDDAVTAARNAFANWHETPFEERVAVIRNFGYLLDKNKDDLAKTISIETGKPLWETYTEVYSMTAKIDISVRAYHERSGVKETELPEARSIVRHKPNGVLAVFGPYNFPGHLPNGHIVPALLAGNTIVFKPSSYTPLVAEKTIHMWSRAGAPPGIINLVQGRKETGTDIASHPGIDGLLFTGSTYTGKILHEQFGAHPGKIIALEMGGNNPLIVTHIPDLNAAIYQTILSSYISSGQRCTCARRLFVPKGLKGDDFISGLARAINKIVVGCYDDKPQPFMGPVISGSTADDLLAAQEKLINAGGKPIVLMERMEHGDAFLSPGLMDASDIGDLPDEEYFGPFLQLFRYNCFDDAIKMANNTAFGLAAGLFCSDPGMYKKFYNEIRAGIVNWNRPLTGASSSAPFGGVGGSGNHRPGAYYAADYCSYPVSSLESDCLNLPEKLSPGITL